MNACHAINIEHLADPKPGDYWHEMFMPIALVLARVCQWVVVWKLASDDRPIVMTIDEFGMWLRYKTIPDKTWAHCIPEHLKHKISDEELVIERERS